VRLFSSAQEFMQAERPDASGCLVLDVRLPGMSGLAFQEELAKTGVALPVIFITGHGDVPMTVRAMKAGAAEFLTKPFDDQVLLDAIHAAIERDRARRRDAASLAALTARYRPAHGAREAGHEARRGGTSEQADRGRARAERRHREGPPRAGHAQDAGEIGCRAGAHG
jgi:FixJ family two-component response regulator